MYLADDGRHAALVLIGSHEGRCLLQPLDVVHGEPSAYVESVPNNRVIARELPGAC